MDEAGASSTPETVQGYFKRMYPPLKPYLFAYILSFLFGSYSFVHMYYGHMSLVTTPVYQSVVGIGIAALLPAAILGLIIRMFMGTNTPFVSPENRTSQPQTGVEKPPLIQLVAKVFTYIMTFATGAAFLAVPGLFFFTLLFNDSGAAETQVAFFIFLLAGIPAIMISVLLYISQRLYRQSNFTYSIALSLMSPFILFVYYGFIFMLSRGGIV